MTSHPQTTSGSGSNKNAADSDAKPAPLDRSSPEWRSQFGVLPSPLQQSVTARPAATVTAAAQRRNPASLIAAALGIIGVGGLIAYGYLPRQQAEKPKSEPEMRGAIVASGSPVKQLRDKAAAVSLPAPAVIETPAAMPSVAPAIVPMTAPSPMVIPSAAPVKLVAPVVATKPEPRRASPPPAVPVRKQEARKPEPEIAAPRSRREAPAVRDTPAPAVVAAAPIPRPERKPTVQKTVARPNPKPVAQQLPKASRPASESIESDGTNPLGLPQ